MANFTDWDDITDEALKDAGEDNSDTGGDYYSDRFRYATEAYVALWGYKPWKFSMAATPGSLNSVAPITGITGAITIDTTSLVLSAAQTPDLDDRKILINNRPYRISAHTGGATAVTLGSAFQEATVTAARVVIFRDEYDISGITRLGSPAFCRDMFNGDRIIRVGDEDRRIQRQLADPSGGDPRVFTMLTDAILAFDYYPTRQQRYEIPYQEYPVDASTGVTPDWPRQWRFILRDYMAHLILLDKGDSKAGDKFLKIFGTRNTDGDIDRMEAALNWNQGLGRVRNTSIYTGDVP